MCGKLVTRIHARPGYPLFTCETNVTESMPECSNHRGDELCTKADNCSFLLLFSFEAVGKYESGTTSRFCTCPVVIALETQISRKKDVHLAQSNLTL